MYTVYIPWVLEWHSVEFERELQAQMYWLTAPQGCWKWPLNRNENRKKHNYQNTRTSFLQYTFNSNTTLWLTAYNSIVHCCRVFIISINLLRGLLEGGCKWGLWYNFFSWSSSFHSCFKFLNSQTNRKQATISSWDYLWQQVLLVAKSAKEKKTTGECHYYSNNQNNFMRWHCNTNSSVQGHRPWKEETAQKIAIPFYQQILQRTGVHISI